MEGLTIQIQQYVEGLRKAKPDAVLSAGRVVAGILAAHRGLHGQEVEDAVEKHFLAEQARQYTVRGMLPAYVIRRGEELCIVPVHMASDGEMDAIADQLEEVGRLTDAVSKALRRRTLTARHVEQFEKMAFTLVDRGVMPAVEARRYIASLRARALRAVQHDDGAKGGGHGA